MHELFLFIYRQPLNRIILAMLLLVFLWGYLAFREGNRPRWRVLNGFFFLGCAAAVFYMTVYTRGESATEAVLIPFHSFREAKIQPELYRSMLMNVFLFVPLGLSLPFVFGKGKWAPFLTVILSMAFSVGIEYLQFTHTLGRCEVDDVIIGIEGKRVKNFAGLQEELAKHRPGDKVKVKVLRNKKEKTLEVELKNEQGTTKVLKDADMEILGAAFREVPAEVKRQLRLGAGVEVTGVTEGKMKAAGVRKGFIILKANGQTVKSVEQLENIMKEASRSTEPVLFLQGIFPSGKRAYFAVDLTQE